MSAVRLILDDCVGALPLEPAASVDAVVTDPPYALVEPNSARSSYAARMADGRTDEDRALRRGGFMGKKWDARLPPVEVWQECLRVLRPGAYLLSFGGTRTWHRLACAIEDAGFQIRDTLMWVYGTGFPKGKACLKPAWEPILLCRKPGPKVLPLPGLNACRVGLLEARPLNRNGSIGYGGSDPQGLVTDGGAGRWPANVAHDGSDEVLEAFAAFGERSGPREAAKRGASGFFAVNEGERHAFDDTGTAARFFYCAKASRAERGGGNTHPTVKPLALMCWLVRLVTPPGGTVLDPFLGSGTTGVAAAQEGLSFVGIEREREYMAIAERRIAEARAALPLFAGATA